MISIINFLGRDLFGALCALMIAGGLDAALSAYLAYRAGTFAARKLPRFLLSNVLPFAVIFAVGALAVRFWPAAEYVYIVALGAACTYLIQDWHGKFKAAFGVDVPANPQDAIRVVLQGISIHGISDAAKSDLTGLLNDVLLKLIAATKDAVPIAPVLPAPEPSANTAGSGAAPTGNSSSPIDVVGSGAQGAAAPSTAAAAPVPSAAAPADQGTPSAGA